MAQVYFINVLWKYQQWELGGKKGLSKLKSNKFKHMWLWSNIQNKHLKGFAVQRHGVLHAPTNCSSDSLSSSTVAVKTTTVVSPEIYSVIQRSIWKTSARKTAWVFQNYHNCYLIAITFLQKVNFSSDMDF